MELTSLSLTAMNNSSGLVGGLGWRTDCGDDDDALCDVPFLFLCEKALEIFHLYLKSFINSTHFAAGK